MVGGVGAGGKGPGGSGSRPQREPGPPSSFDLMLRSVYYRLRHLAEQFFGRNRYPNPSVDTVRRMLSAILLRGAQEHPAVPFSWRRSYSEVAERLNVPLGMRQFIGVGLSDGPGRPEIIILVVEDRFSNRSLEGALERFTKKARVQVTQIVTGPVRPASALRSRPAQGGDSVGLGSLSGETGSIGAVVADADDHAYLLSCNHVIAGVNGATRGAPVWQPGPLDGGLPGDTIGVLFEFCPITLDGVTPNRIDAALADLVDVADCQPGIRQLGPIRGTAVPRLRATVRKCGWATDVTDGVIRGRKFECLIPFEGKGDALFQDVYLISKSDGKFADRGDSGSIVIDANNKAIGMVTGVMQRYALVAPIDPILDYFGVAFV